MQFVGIIGILLRGGEENAMDFLNRLEIFLDTDECPLKSHIKNRFLEVLEVYKELVEPISVDSRDQQKILRINKKTKNCIKTLEIALEEQNK